MAKPRERQTGSEIERKGGYPAGPRTVEQLAPPPQRPGLGAKPAAEQPKK